MAFSRGVQEITKGNLLAPILRGELMKPKFRSFDITVEGWKDRPWDGWFHPSTHSAWPARKLALYLTRHELEIEEEPDLEKVFAVTQGHFFHTFAGNILLRNGILEALEIPYEDPQHRRRGHMDGRMTGGGEGWEFKTINNEFLLKKIKDVETLREFKPGYYSQAQDYLDMHGLEGMRFLMMAMFYPYKMLEFVIPRDEPFQKAQRTKYREAIEMTEELPPACCEPRSTEARGCEMRMACPVGRAAVKAGRR